MVIFLTCLHKTIKTLKEKERPDSAKHHLTEKKPNEKTKSKLYGSSAPNFRLPERQNLPDWKYLFRETVETRSSCF